MLLTLAASSSPFGPLGAPSLQVILLFIALFAALNILEKGRWD